MASRIMLAVKQNLVSLAGIHLCEVCNTDCAHKTQLCQEHQQSQHGLRLLHLYAHIVVSSDCLDQLMSTQLD